VRRFTTPLTTTFEAAKWITPEISLFLLKNPVICIYPKSNFSNAGIFSCDRINAV
jgi:hypothetical protein